MAPPEANFRERIMQRDSVPTQKLSYHPTLQPALEIGAWKRRGDKKGGRALGEVVFHIVGCYLISVNRHLLVFKWPPFSQGT